MKTLTQQYSETLREKQRYSAKSRHPRKTILQNGLVNIVVKILKAQRRDRA
jgi:hypothetical protein